MLNPIIIFRGGQTVIRFKTEPKTEITENRKLNKMKTETETEKVDNRNRKTENRNTIIKTETN